MSKTLITITGPSGSGKTTLLRNLLESGKYKDIVSVTTRPQRDGEIDGIDYTFVSEKDFDNIDMMEVIEFNGCKYGATVQDFNNAFKQGKIPIIVVLPDGVRQIVDKSKQHGWKVVSIYIDGNEHELNKRFLDRFSSEENISDLIDYYAKRMSSLHTEKANWYDEVCSYNEVLYINNYTSNNEEVVHDMIRAYVEKARQKTRMVG